jgi:hypothetical protein
VHDIKSSPLAIDAPSLKRFESYVFVHFHSMTP